MARQPRAAEPKEGHQRPRRIPKEGGGKRASAERIRHRQEYAQRGGSVRPGAAGEEETRARCRIRAQGEGEGTRGAQGQEGRSQGEEEGRQGGKAQEEGGRGEAGS